MAGMNLADLGNIGWALGIGGLTIAMVIYAIATMKENLASGSADVNNTFDDTVEGLAELPQWYPVIGAVIGIVFVIGFLRMTRA